MTQFIKVTGVAKNPQTLYINALSLVCIFPAQQWGCEHTQVRVKDSQSNMSDIYRDYSVKETPEEILAQLK